MPIAVSALEYQPFDFTREVSPAAITFYVDELRGVYLPNDFRDSHRDVADIKSWQPEDRLHGKFGRFMVKRAQNSEECEDILVMGTTMGLSGLDRHERDLSKLRHRVFNDTVRDVLDRRGLLGKSVSIDPVDYGSTGIVVGENGIAGAIEVGRNSYEFGRATAEGRQETCDLFRQLLGNAVEVINKDPEPSADERIMR